MKNVVKMHFFMDYFFFRHYKRLLEFMRDHALILHSNSQVFLYSMCVQMRVLFYFQNKIDSSLPAFNASHYFLNVLKIVKKYYKR